MLFRYGVIVLVILVASAGALAAQAPMPVDYRIGIESTIDRLAQSGPPPHAPAHGYRAKKQYYYYPGPQVYFDPIQSMYFYLTNGNWAMSVTLPPHLRIDLSSPIHLELETDQPYLYHSEIIKKYPPGQVKKIDGQPKGQAKGKSKKGKNK